MLLVPLSKPVTTPPVLTEATDVLLLLHTPDPVLSLKTPVRAEHNVEKPVIIDGKGFTVTLVEE
jgi:hypothetical protein